MSLATARSLQTPQKGTPPPNYHATSLSYDEKYTRVEISSDEADNADNADNAIHANLSGKAAETSRTSQAEQKTLPLSKAVKVGKIIVKYVKYTVLVGAAISLTIGFLMPGVPTTIVVTFGFDYALPSFASFVMGIFTTVFAFVLTDDLYPSLVAIYKTALALYRSDNRSAFIWQKELAKYQKWAEDCISQKDDFVMRQLQDCRRDLDMEKKNRMETDRKLETCLQDLITEKEKRSEDKMIQDLLKKSVMDMQDRLFKLEQKQ
ncbi:hypothetical protein BGZ59_001770 [Podila verticillata]|nr:hypothetical protein BGZ59_001770 [Podila verticillata]